MISGLGARVHLFVRPADREAFIGLFHEVLQCTVRELEFGLPHPIVLVSFPDGSALSVEFNADTPTQRSTLSGAWIEFRTADPQNVQRKLLDAGVEHFSHPASPHRYFRAPGGQVFRVLDLKYAGP
ncbi:MAG: hypothetical protein ABR508_09635 [Candidatus Baltobacteraceae bacterium]